MKKGFKIGDCYSWSLNGINLFEAAQGAVREASFHSERCYNKENWNCVSKVIPTNYGYTAFFSATRLR